MIGDAHQTQHTIIQGSIVISANDVTCRDIIVQGSGTGITANNISNLTLINMTSYGNSIYGSLLNTVTTATVVGGTYSKNTDHGLRIVNSSNITLTNVVADSNGMAGVQLNHVTGSTVLTNITARKNALHGLYILYESSGVIVQGGTFSNNGVNQYYDGGGIAIDGTSKTVSNITVNGPLTAENNKTAGIWLTAPAGIDSVKNVVIGQSGVVSLSFHNSGGVIVYGNVYATTITANFTRGTQAAAGILLLGVDNSGTRSPQNTVINNCTFSGYIPGPIGTIRPAITLTSGIGQKSNANATGSGNTFVGYADAAAIESIVYHYPDDPALGVVTLTNNNPLPVELFSFTSAVTKQSINLCWTTATEVNNFGFEIQRQFSGRGSWEGIGFVEGNGTSNIQHEYTFKDIGVGRGTYSYRLKQIDRDGSFAYSESIEVEKRDGVVPGRASLEAYPNPFNGTTNFVFEIPETGFTTLIVYDIVGRKEKEIFSGTIQEGNIHSIKFDAGSLPSGIYFCVLHHRASSTIIKLLVTK